MLGDGRVPSSSSAKKLSGLKDIDEARAASFLGFLGDFLRYVY
jgi:hypothetical protein